MKAAFKKYPLQAYRDVAKKLSKELKDPERAALILQPATTSSLTVTRSEDHNIHQLNGILGHTLGRRQFFRASSVKSVESLVELLNNRYNHYAEFDPSAAHDYLVAKCRVAALAYEVGQQELAEKVLETIPVELLDTASLSLVISSSSKSSKVGVVLLRNTAIARLRGMVDDFSPEHCLELYCEMLPVLSSHASRDHVVLQTELEQAIRGYLPQYSTEVLFRYHLEGELKKFLQGQLHARLQAAKEVAVYHQIRAAEAELGLSEAESTVMPCHNETIDLAATVLDSDLLRGLDSMRFVDANPATKTTRVRIAEELVDLFLLRREDIVLRVENLKSGVLFESRPLSEYAEKHAWTPVADKPRDDASDFESHNSYSLSSNHSHSSDLVHTAPVPSSSSAGKDIVISDSQACTLLTLLLRHVPDSARLARPLISAVREIAQRELRYEVKMHSWSLDGQAPPDSLPEWFVSTVHPGVANTFGRGAMGAIPLQAHSLLLRELSSQNALDRKLVDVFVKRAMLLLELSYRDKLTLRAATTSVWPFSMLLSMPMVQMHLLDVNDIAALSAMLLRISALRALSSNHSLYEQSLSQPVQTVLRKLEEPAYNAMSQIVDTILDQTTIAAAEEARKERGDSEIAAHSFDIRNILTQKPSMWFLEQCRICAHALATAFHIGDRADDSQLLFAEAFTTVVNGKRKSESRRQRELELKRSWLGHALSKPSASRGDKALTLDDLRWVELASKFTVDPAELSSTGDEALPEWEDDIFHALSVVANEVLVNPTVDVDVPVIHLTVPVVVTPHVVDAEAGFAHLVSGKEGLVVSQTGGVVAADGKQAASGAGQKGVTVVKKKGKAPAAAATK